MLIRQANKFDFPQVFDMLKDFRDNAPLDEIKNCNVNEQAINSLFMSIVAGRGLVCVAQTDEDSPLCGMILGIIDSNIWDADILVLKELAFWVKPEQRNSTVGYRLLKQYGLIAQELKEKGRISLYTMTKMTNSPDIKFDKFGYTKVEEVWVA